MQRIFFGLANGSLYAMMALALGVVFSTTGITNFAHAAVIMLGAMTSFWCMTLFGMPYLAAIAVSILVTIIINILIYKLCVEKLGNLNTGTEWIVTTFGASIIIENVARMIFGTEPHAYPYLFEGKMIHIFGANILVHEVLMIVIAVAIGIVYQTVMQKTRFGRAVRAVSFRQSTAKLMGISSEKVVVSCFAIAGAIAAIAGALIAPITFASYTMTASIGIKGYAAAVIGGIGNTKGAFIGGILLGIIEAVVGAFLPSSIKDAVSFLVMIVFIIFLPGGVMGAKLFNKGQRNTEKV